MGFLSSAAQVETHCWLAIRDECTMEHKKSLEALQSSLGDLRKTTANEGELRELTSEQRNHLHENDQIPNHFSIDRTITFLTSTFDSLTKCHNKHSNTSRVP